MPGTFSPGSIFRGQHAKNVTILFAIAPTHLSMEVQLGAGLAFLGLHIDVDLDLTMEITEQFANVQPDILREFASSALVGLQALIEAFD